MQLSSAHQGCYSLPSVSKARGSVPLTWGLYSALILSNKGLGWFLKRCSFVYLYVCSKKGYSSKEFPVTIYAILQHLVRLTSSPQAWGLGFRVCCYAGDPHRAILTLRPAAGLQAARTSLCKACVQSTCRVEHVRTRQSLLLGDAHLPLTLLQAGLGNPLGMSHQGKKRLG